jgi:hypothetical protein
MEYFRSLYMTSASLALPSAPKKKKKKKKKAIFTKFNYPLRVPSIRI